MDLDVVSEFFTGDVLSLDNVALFLMRAVVAFIFIMSFMGKSKDVKGFAKGTGVPLPMCPATSSGAAR